ncbi:MAG TPA: hypothetical protein PK733_10745 [Clostridiales bacterium]|nr:hypothetical protein [Clostridiales bacterium]
MFRNTFKDIFKGKYGIDNLTLTLVFAALVFYNIKYLWVIGIVLSGYAIFRTFSKDINKRYQELQKFNMLVNKIWQYINRSIQWIRFQYGVCRTRLQQRKQYVFFKCPKCKKTLRLPKNKGKLQVTCPVCKYEFFKKT